MKLIFILFIASLVIIPNAYAIPYISCQTNSMYPLINCSDTNTKYFINKDYKIIYYKEPIKQVQIGEVIIFGLDAAQRKQAKLDGYLLKEWVVHRVVGIVRNSTTTCNKNMCITGYNDYFITKGDNNPDRDPWKVRYNQAKWKLKMLP